MRSYAFWGYNERMNITICTPVTGKTLEEFLKNLEQIQTISDFIELRVDTIEGLTPKDIDIIKSNTTKKTNFISRAKDEGGNWKGKDSDRLLIIEKAATAGFDYIDVELSTLKDHEINRPEDTKLIVSYHNFDETPKYWKLTGVINEMQKHEPDLIKIATTVKKDDDNQTLFRLLVDRPGEEEWIIIGMGEKGKITRIMAPIMGGHLTFASTKFGETAPGQIDIEELKSLYKQLGY